MADELPTQTLDAAITKLTAESALDERGQEVLAAAITLRDASGRDRATALRLMTYSWGVNRRVKIEGKWKDRPLATLASEIETAVCLAAAKWQPRSAGERAEQHVAPEHGDRAEQRGVAEHAPATSSTMVLTDDRRGAGRTDQAAHGRDDPSPSEVGPAKKARTSLVESTQATGGSRPHRAGREPQILELPETQEDVVSLRRLGPDHYEATKRSGDLWRGDAELLESLPQGKAKLATLWVTEIQGSKKAKTTGDQPALAPRKADGDSREPPSKTGSADTGAAEHVLGVAGASATAQEEPGRETGAAGLGPELFSLNTPSDQALLEWLRAREAEPRCGALLQQIREWTGHHQRNAMRSLASAHGVCVSRSRQATAELLLETVRAHFRSAIAQEKGRLATFDFHVSTVAPAPLAPLPAEAEQPIQAADVVDLAEGAATRGVAEHTVPNRTVANAARCTPEQAGDSAAATSLEPPEKKQRKLEEKPSIEEPGASEHVPLNSTAAATAPEDSTRETAASTTGAELFAHDNSSDHALLEWLRAQDAQPRCAALLQQISEWTGKVRQREIRALVTAQGIPVGRGDHASTDKLRAAVRRHFREAVAQEKGRLAFFDFQISTGASEHLAPLPAGAEQPLQAADVVDIATMTRYRRQHADLPNALKEAILGVAGGIALNRQRLRGTAKSLGVGLQHGLQYPGGDQATRGPRLRNLPLVLQQTMLTATCIRRVRAWGAAAAAATACPSRIFTTPRTLPELANMLRDPEGRLLCPFGADFEESSGAGSRLCSVHRIPFWLALLELHGDGHRYGVESERRLPYVFEQVIGILRQRRVARQEASPGAAEHSLVVPEDLVNALVANPVFKHKIATHDLLTYALKESGKYLSQITTEQLQHGDMMAPDSLMPAAAAEVIATTFFDFVVKDSLANTMQEMSSEQIQVIAVFLNHLLRKPPKRIHISERLDLIQKKPAYIPADAITSPQVLPSRTRLPRSSTPLPPLSCPVLRSHVLSYGVLCCVVVLCCCVVLCCVVLCCVVLCCGVCVVLCCAVLWCCVVSEL